MTTDLSTNYLGLKLANPIVVSACPLTSELDVLRKLADLGASAAVLPSIFEEQLDGGRLAEGYGGAIEDLAHFKSLNDYNRGPEDYLKQLTAAKKAVSIPIVGSLNVASGGGGLDFARRIEQAGADALELNIYYLVTDPDVSSQEVEARYIEHVMAVRRQISIPLAVKISPYFTALPNFARRLVDAGANGLVLFNRFLQPDIDLDKLCAAPRLMLSTREEMRLPLRWVALLYGRVHASLAATTGVHSADDAIKLLLAGADVTMVASTLYRNGVDIVRTLVDGVAYWLEANDFRSLEQMKGSLSQRKCPNPGAFERANYTRVLSSYLDEIQR